MKILLSLTMGLLFVPAIRPATQTNDADLPPLTVDVRRIQKADGDEHLRWDLAIKNPGPAGVIVKRASISEMLSSVALLDDLGNVWQLSRPAKGLGTNDVGIMIMRGHTEVESIQTSGLKPRLSHGVSASGAPPLATLRYKIDGAVLVYGPNPGELTKRKCVGEGRARVGVNANDASK